MTALHQIIAIERGVAQDTDQHLAKIRHVLAIGGDNDPLTGISRTYESSHENGDQLPPQSRKVQFTVTELLGAASAHLARLFDLKLTREFANCSARADVTLRDGTTLLRDVPAGYLLFLEGQLAELIKLIERLPELNPAEEWHANDPALPEGVWKSDPSKTLRTKKVPQVQVLYAATPEHPAQVRTYDTDVVEGYWTTVKLSGQLPAREIQAMRARATDLLHAVKFAREQANTMTVTDRQAGEALLSYVFGG
jgi:hypothetical protein